MTEPKTISRDAGSPRSWEEERARLGEGDTYWIATTGPSGAAHLVPVLAVVVDGVLHLVAGPGSRKARNLAREPRCVIGTSADGVDIVVEGTAIRVGDEDRLQRVAEAYAGKYAWHVTVRDGAFHDEEGAPTAGPPPYDVYEIRPSAAYAFGTVEPARSTRWRFGE